MRPDEHILRRELRDGAGTCISGGLSAAIRGAPLRDAIAYATSPREDFWRLRCRFPSLDSDAPLAIVRLRNMCPPGRLWLGHSVLTATQRLIPASRPSQFAES